MVRLGSPRTEARHTEINSYPFALSFVEGLLSSFHTVRRSEESYLMKKLRLQEIPSRYLYSRSTNPSLIIRSIIELSKNSLTEVSPLLS
jgi:hypothetical protein